jgi:hypothetical protein
MVRSFVGLLFAAALFAVSNSAWAVTLQVDFGTQDESAIVVGASANRVAPGYEDFSHGPELSGGGIDQATKLPPATLTRIYGAISVTASDPHPASNGLFFADEGTVVAGALEAVVDDFVYPSGPDLHVTLSGLAAGLWGVSTFHHRPLATAADTLDGITVDTGGGPQTVATDVPISFGLTPSSLSKKSFQFIANGTDDVVIVIQGRIGLFPMPLNGFLLIAIPEPSSTLLAVLGAGLASSACLRRSWRRSRPGR